MKLKIGNHVFDDDTKLVLVSHVKPDADCIAATYLFLYALDRLPTDPNIRFVFVNHGNRFTDPVDSGEVVVHFDTGRVLDLGQLIFDHHFIDTYYVSATHAVYGTLMREMSVPQAITDLVTYLDLADSGGRVGRISDSEMSLIKTASSNLREAGVPGKFVPDYVGPTCLSKFVQSFPSSLSDQARMLFGLFLLDGYCEKYVPADPLFDVKISSGGAVDAPPSNVVADGAVKESPVLLTRNDLPQANNFQIVLPVDFNMDEVVAANLLLMTLQLPIGSPNVRFVFMDRRAKLLRSNDEATAVIHLGLGGEYSTAEWIFDPMARDFPFASVTQAILPLYLATSRSSASSVKDLVRFINFYCGGAPERRLSDRQIQIVMTEHQSLVATMKHPVRFRRFNNAPIFLLETLSFLPEHLSSDQRFMIMLLVLSGYLEQENTRGRILAFVGESNVVEGRGLRIACIAANAYEKRDLRSAMNNLKSRADLYVAEFETGLDEITDRRFTVTIMNRRKQIRGMERLVASILDHDPGLSRDSQDDVYLHHERFLLYVGVRTNLTLEDIFKLTVEHLSAVD